MTSSMTGYQGMQGPNGQVGNKIPKGYKLGQIQQYTPAQMQEFERRAQELSSDSPLRRLGQGDQAAIDEFEAPALRQFNQIQGNIASRFSGGSGAGSLGQRNSSAFQNANTQAASSFAQDLAGRRQDLMRQAREELRASSNDLLSARPYENMLIEKQQNNGWAQAAGTALGGAAGLYFGGGNPQAAIAGAKLGNQIGSAF